MFEHPEARKSIEFILSRGVTFEEMLKDGYFSNSILTKQAQKMYMEKKNMKIIPQMEPLYDEEDKKAVTDYLNSDGWLMEHKHTEQLEKMLCNITKAKYCSMVPNGTLSLTASLVALGIKPGDEIIVPDYTIIATATSASFIGAKPVFVDVEPKTFAIDVNELKKRITSKTKAIMLVHINGRPARDWVEILDLAQTEGIPVIEDAAQCLGSYYNVEHAKVHLGTLGVMGSFSFSMSKIVTMGCGGAIITDDAELHHTIELMKDFGREKGGRDVNIYPGIDLKFTDLQAVLGISMLKRLDQRVKRKKEMYRLYEEELKNTVEMVDTNLKYTSPWFNDIMLRSRAQRIRLVMNLKENGVETRNFYPSITTQTPFEQTGFPVSRDVSSRGLWLPSSLKLSDDDILYVCNKIKDTIKKS